ncbi:hypothetical protein [Streptomyces chartreusis]
MAAVVARHTVWACHLNNGTWAPEPEQTTLPEDLPAVPATGEAGHGDWLRRWDHHMTRRT